MINMKTKFNNANEAFEYILDKLIINGQDFDNTKTLFNLGFYILNPLDNIITNKERAWKQEYADAEWKWYLTGNKSIDKLGEIYGSIPPIWENMTDLNRCVNSNYGYQWKRNHQLDYIVAKLKDNPNTRHAAITIYDGKEHQKYRKDTPCTYAVQFTIFKNVLNMSVMMRSNDIWFGFCNDQYCFSMLQKSVADRLSINVGSYIHFALNFHIYNNKL